MTTEIIKQTNVKIVSEQPKGLLQELLCTNASAYEEVGRYLQFLNKALKNHPNATVTKLEIRNSDRYGEKPCDKVSFKQVDEETGFVADVTIKNYNI